jgi:hypothetical protein
MFQPLKAHSITVFPTHRPAGTAKVKAEAARAQVLEVATAEGERAKAQAKVGAGGRPIR